MGSLDMQPIKSEATLPTPPSRRHPFMSEMERLAMRGMEAPESLTSTEISAMCRLAFVAMSVGGGVKSRRNHTVDVPPTARIRGLCAVRTADR